MNQQNRLALVLTGLTTFLLGAGSYWLAFDRPGKPPTSIPDQSVVAYRKPQAGQPPPTVQSQPEARDAKRVLVDQRRKKDKNKQTKIDRKKKRHGPIRVVKTKNSPPAG